jgi:hypothetical protein
MVVVVKPARRLVEPGCYDVEQEILYICFNSSVHNPLIYLRAYRTCNAMTLMPQKAKCAQLLIL